MKRSKMGGVNDRLRYGEQQARVGPSFNRETMEEKQMSTRVMTPEFTASYVTVFEPREGPDGGDPRYSVQCIFSKDDDLSDLKAAIKEAAEQRWGDKIPKKLKIPLRDGDKERADDSVYKNSIFMNANSKQQPGVVDRKVKPIIDTDEFYSGCRAKATVNFFAYDRSGSKGVGAGLQNVQKIADGDRLDGRKAAEEDFPPLSDEEFDEMLG